MSREPRDSRPVRPISALGGKGVVNTRSPDQAHELDQLLSERGAIPLSYPCIDIAPPNDPAPLGRALDQLAHGAFDWLVLTSANAVRAVADAMIGSATRAGGDGSEHEARHVLTRGGIGKTRVAVIGPATAAAARDLLTLPIDLEPGTYTAEALARELAARRPGRVLIPQADRAGDFLARALATHGTDVTVVTAYRTVLGSGGVDLAAMLRDDRVDALTFTSPSTVDNLALRLKKQGGEWASLSKLCIACIGPVTTRAAADKGLHVDVEPGEHTMRGLVGALEAYFSTPACRGSRSHA